MIPSHLVHVSEEVRDSQQAGTPIVALESTVIAHGLPWPVSFETAMNMEKEIRTVGGIPATIGMCSGVATIGMSAQQIESLANNHETVLKAGRRDIAHVCIDQKTAATTVSSTIYLASLAGIRFFATGGIGGVHLPPAHPWDVSADLSELSKTAVAVICSGAKSILDISATLEVLESYSVPVLGFQTDEFPGFYLRSSHQPVSCRVEDPEQVARIAESHWILGGAGLVVANPIPREQTLSESELNDAISIANKQALNNKIGGKELTPFLLSAVQQLTNGKSTEANVALLINNARLAAEISVAYSKKTKMG